METDRIEKRIELKAPVSRVWRALTDYREFSRWFRVDLEGPFVVGQKVEGQMTYPGAEAFRFEAKVLKMEHERLFSFTWPQVNDPAEDTSKSYWTLLEFRLEPIPGGTLLLATESGFGKIPPDLRAGFLRNNEQGWAEQLKNIENHVSQAS